MNKELTLHRAYSIMGWMSDAELLFLAEQASNAKVIFEVGSFIGRSARAMGDNADGIVFCIDPWQASNFAAIQGVAFFTDELNFNHFYCNLSDLIKKGVIIPIRSKWLEWEPPVKADFIFIDGDHRYQTVKGDILKAERHIKRGGIIAGHDYAHPWTGVTQAVDELYHKDEVNVIDTIWWVRA